MPGPGEAAGTGPDADGGAYRATVWCIVGGIVLLAVGQGIAAGFLGSDPLLKDALDWSYVILLNGIAAFVHGRGGRAERVSAYAVGSIFVVGGFHTLYGLWEALARRVPEDAVIHTYSAWMAFAVSLAAWAALARFRSDANPLVRATWLSARNDAAIALFGAVAVLGLGADEMAFVDHVMDAAMAALCFQAAYVTFRGARPESDRQQKTPGDASLPGR